MSVYVVGDIQGCLQPLESVLEAVSFDPGQDMLWSVGDLVNRGPRSLDTLRFLYGMRENLTAVLGNHDLHLLATAAGVRKPSRADTLHDILDAPDRDALLDWLAGLPLVHHESGYTLVHAGIPPQWSIKEALAYAREVEDVLRSTERNGFLADMYGNEPALWSDDLAGTERLRVITNYLTRMRYCTADGTLELLSKGPTPDQPRHMGQPVAPWFQHEGRAAAGDKILFGHWASLEGISGTTNTIALDTGCVWGGTLTLYCLETGAFTRCDCMDTPKP